MNALLVYPHFPVTYWGFRYGLRLIGKRAALPPLGLITVAALLPSDWRVRLVDLNVGALAQENSTGNSAVIHTGEFERLTTGPGIRHKEMTASRTDWARVSQIFLHPSEVGLNCVREQNRFTAEERRNVLCVVASPDGRKGSLRIHQDALFYSRFPLP